MSEHRFRELDQAWERSQAHKEERSGVTRKQSLNRRHDHDLREIEKAKQALEAAQAKLDQAYIALGRTLALMDIVELEDK